MEQIVVYKLDGTVRSSLRNRAGGCALVSAEFEEFLMASETVSVTVESIDSIAFTVGDYIIIDGLKYRMNQAPQVIRDNRELFVYTIVFESAKYDLMNCMFLLPDTSRDDYFTATLAELAQMVVDNANRVYPNQWALGDCPDKTDVITEQFTEQSCLVALQSICEAYDLQFRIVEENNVKTINIIEQGENTTLNLEYGRGHGLYSLQREATTSEEMITRLFVYGSGENLPTGYPHTRLCLPYSGSDPNVNRRNVSYIENASKIAQFGLKEGIVIFDDEKPHCKSKITQIYSSNRCKFKDTNIDFDILAYWQADDFTEFCTMRGYDPNDATVQQLFTDDIVGQERKYIVDGHATITFNTGNLAGYSFQLDDYDASTHAFTIHPIVVNEGDEILEQTIPDPNSAAFQFAVGDEYVISDIIMPYEFVNDPTTASADTPKGAEQRLAKRASDYYAEHSKVCARYSIVFDRIYLMRNHSGGLRVVCGDYIHIKDTKLGINSWIKVTRYYRNLLTDEVTVEISDIKPRDPNVFWIDLYNNDIYERAIDDFGGHSYTQQTTLTCVFTPNYNTSTDTYNKNTVSITNGLFTDKTLAGRKRVWHLYDRIKTDFLSSYEYDVFVKASKRTQDAQIYFEPVFRTLNPINPSTEFIRHNVEYLDRRQAASLSRRDENYYYFKIGTLSKPSRRFLTQRLARTLTLEYGEVNLPASSVVGGDIHIIDADGNVVIDSATRAAYLDTITALSDASDPTSRVNVGAQAGRVPLIIDNDNHIIAARIGNSFIIERMINNGAVTETKIANNAVTNAKIKAGEIDITKFNNAVKSFISLVPVMQRFVNAGSIADRHISGDRIVLDSGNVLKITSNVKIVDSLSKMRLNYSTNSWQKATDVTINFSSADYESQEAYDVYAKLAADGSCDYLAVKSGKAVDGDDNLLVCTVSSEDGNGQRSLTMEIGETYLEDGVLKDFSGHTILDIKNGLIKNSSNATIFNILTGVINNAKISRNRTLTDLVDEITSARTLRKLFTGAENGTFDFTDGNGNDVNIQDILGKTPTSAGGLRGKVTDLDTNKADSSEITALTTRLNNARTIMQAMQSNIINLTNRMIDLQDLTFQNCGVREFNFQHMGAGQCSTTATDITEATLTF